MWFLDLFKGGRRHAKPSRRAAIRPVEALDERVTPVAIGMIRPGVSLGPFTTAVGGFNAAVLTTQSIQRLEEIWRTDIPEKGLQGNGVIRIRTKVGEGG